MISIIIATRDRAALLHDTLEAISRQASPGYPFEVLVVDNASIDRTPEVVANAASRMGVPVVYLHESRPGKSHALNTAVGHAQGDFLVFTDDDVLPAPGWLAGYARAFTETGGDYVVGRILPLWEATPPIWMSPALYGVLAVPDGGTERLMIQDKPNNHIMPLGANMAVRRKVVNTIGGWNPNLGKLQGTLRTGEDHEFALRMVAAGFPGVYEPDAVVQHRVPAERLQLSYFQRWFFDNGVIVAGLERGYPTTPHYVLHIPRHLWRELLADIAGLALASLRLDIRTAIARYMRIVWFAGYTRARKAKGFGVQASGTSVGPRVGETS
ncbi:MAG: glycosyltransferase [Acidobacteria bacterium]|nr:glycosyltransferase [Acidobacteriota bacterium]